MSKRLLAVAVMSALVAIFVVLSGQRDPTDSAHWYLGLFCTAFIAGLLLPLRPWRGGVAVLLPQLLLPFVPQPSNLWPLSLIFLALLLLPLTLVACLGAWIRRRLT